MFLETLGERTVALAQLERRRDPDAGYEPMLERLLEPILAQVNRLDPIEQHRYIRLIQGRCGKARTLAQTTGARADRLSRNGACARRGDAQKC